MNFVVNAEYERDLFKDIVKPLSEQEIHLSRVSRQYLFYYINQDPKASLLSYWDLPEETKDYFESLGIKLPHHTRENSNSVNWYGELKDLELERNLNNKLSVYELLKSYDEIPDNVHIVNSPSEIRSILSSSGHKKWILKSPYSCGGQNIRFITSDGEIPESLEYSHILEPYLDRVLDLSLYYDPKSKDQFYYVSHIHQNCTYLGGRVYQDKSMLDQDLKNDGVYEIFMEVIRNLERYLEILKKHNLSQPLTLDSFIYRENNKLRGYPLCETNYRISMGTLNQNLRKFLPEKGVGLLMALKADLSKDWKSILPYSTSTKTGIISLNEGNPKSAILLLSAPNLKTLYKYNQLVFNFEK